MKKHTVYIGIGSNLGNSTEYVLSAISQLQQLPFITLVAKSSLYRSAPVNASGNDYINAVICIHTSLSPDILLEQLHQIENRHGRKRTYRNAPRTLDLDILLYDDFQMESVSLTLPHPRITERAFVLIPLLEINPEIMIPGKLPAQEYVESVQAQRISILSI